MKSLAPIAILLSVTAAQAAPPPIQIVQVPGGPSAMRRYPGVSDAGNAILAEAQNAPDPQLNELVRQQRAIRDQLMAAGMAATVDVDKVQALLKQREDLQAQFRQRMDDRLIAAIRQLPIADRGPFMRAMAMPPR